MTTLIENEQESVSKVSKESRGAERRFVEQKVESETLQVAGSQGVVPGVQEAGLGEGNLHAHWQADPRESLDRNFRV